MYELSAIGRTFDVILCLGVYYHLWDPLLALVQLRQCCHRDTVVVIEGELAWSGMTPYEARYFQSAWQECVLAAPLLERLLRLAYFRVDDQVWMHPVPDTVPSPGALEVDRSMLICRPFEGTNPMYTYQPHFGLRRFDDRFRGDGTGPPKRRAQLTVIELPRTVAAGDEMSAIVRVTNTGDSAWRPLRLIATQRPLLSGHSQRAPTAGLDVEQAFLAKHVVPGDYRNIDQVACYRRHIEENWLEGSVTLGVQLWDAAGQTRIDQDYSRGFLEEEMPPGGSATVSVRMRAPMSPGRYTLRFDMVCEYVCWFASEGSADLIAPVTVV